MHKSNFMYLKIMFDLLGAVGVGLMSDLFWSQNICFYPLFYFQPPSCNQLFICKNEWTKTRLIWFDVASPIGRLGKEHEEEG